LEIRFHKRQVLFLVVKTVKCKRGIRPKYAYEQCVTFGKKLQKNTAPVRTGIRGALTRISVI